MTLAGTVIRLRPVEATDAAVWLTWRNDPELMLLMDRTEIVDAAAHQAFFDAVILPGIGSRWFAIEYGERSIGQIWLWDIHPRHRRAEIRILIGERAAWSRGLGTDAVRTLAQHAFASLKLHKVYAYVHAANERSRRTFLRAGFVEEAVLRDEAYRDAGFSSVSRFAAFAPDQM